MNTIKSFVKMSLLGGSIVLLPIGLLLAAFGWVFGLIELLIQPLTKLVTGESDLSQLTVIEKLSADAIVLGLIIAACFLIGIIIKTQVGQFIHEQLEGRILNVAPGYNLIKETVLQFLGNRPSPFSSVALVRIFGNETMVTAFVTERHENGSYTVFVPTGPNPTSGNIYHMKPEFVNLIDQSVEDVMRSIISCGAGSDAILKAMHQTSV